SGDRERPGLGFCEVKQGTAILVPSDTAGNQIHDRVALAANGDFIVVWMHSLQDNGPWDVCGQRFDFHGDPLASEFEVPNAASGDTFESPAVAMDAAGAFVVAWQARFVPDGDWDVSRTPRPPCYGRVAGRSARRFRAACACCVSRASGAPRARRFK